MGVFAFFRRKAKPDPPSPPTLSPQEGEERFGQLFSQFQEQGYFLERELESGSEWRTLAAVGVDGGRSVLRLFAGYGPEILSKAEHFYPTQGRLEHPRLSPFRAMGSFDMYRPWLARAYVVGSPLCVTEVAPMPQALEWLSQICQALAVLHRSGLAHHRLKPGNVLLGPEGVVLTDMALPQGEESPAGPPREHSSEELLYLAPETIMGNAGAPGADLYAVGVLAYQLLTGKPPLPPRSDFMQALMDVIQTQPPSLGQERSDLPGALVALVDRLLSKDLQQRSLSAQDLSRAFLFGEPQRVRSGVEMQALLGELQQAGELQSQGAFTLDQGKALEKLGRFQFLHPQDFLLALLAAASSLGAKSLDVTASRSQLELKYDCAPLSEHQLEDLFSHAFTARGLCHLALGLAGAVGLPGARVTITSGRHCASLTRLEALRLKPTRPVNGLHLSIKPAGGLQPRPLLSGNGDPPAHVAERFRLAPIPMRWNGQLLNPHGVHLVDGLAVALPGPHPGLYRMLDGMAFAEPHSLGVPDAQVVMAGAWKVDLSYQQLVASDLEQAEKLCARAWTGLERAARRLAVEEPITRKRMDVYQQICSLPGLREPLAQRIETAVLTWEEDYFHPLAETLCPPESPLRVRSGFLRQSNLTWAQVRHLADRVHGEGSVAYWECLLRAWQCRNDLQPTLDELPPLMASDPQQALVKLRRIPCSGPHGYLSPLFAAALSLGATAVEVTALGTTVCFRYEGATLSRELAETLFVSPSRALVPLTLGLVGVLRAAPTVEISCPDGSATLVTPTAPSPQGRGTLVTPACWNWHGGGAGNSLILGWRHTLSEPSPELCKRLLYFPIPVRWKGKLLNAEQAEFVDDLWVSLPAARSGYFRMQEGLLFEERHHFLVAGARVVQNGRWETDLDYARLQPAALRENAAESRLLGLAEEVALRSPLRTAQLDWYEQLLPLLPVPVREAFYSRLVTEAMAGTPDPAHPLLLQAREQVRLLDLPGRLEAARRLVDPACGHLDGLDWNETRELLREAFAGRGDLYWRNLLGAWLRSSTLQPSLEEIPELLRQVSAFSEMEQVNPDSALLLALQRFMRDVSHRDGARCSQWLRWIPEDCPQTRAHLRG